MKINTVSERGQVLVLIALAIIGLVGITGLAIDGSMILADRRHAQNAADTAALAAALAKIQAQAPPPDGSGMTDVEARAPMKTVGLDRAISNGYYPDLLSSQVEVYACDEAGASCPAPYTGSNNYVQVIITSNVDTFFARVLGISQLHNRVQAIALTDDDDSGPLGNGNSIVSYAKKCENPVNFTISGGPTVTLDGGGMFVNNLDPTCGFVCNTSAGEITGDITTVGGTVSTSDHCSTNIDGTISEGTGQPIDFPIYVEDLGLEVPTECTGPIGSYTNYPAGYLPPLPYDQTHPYPGYPTEKVTVLHPGRYGQFPPPKDSPALALNDVMLMDPGVYCVSDVIRWNQDKFVLVGHDITIFIRAGYDFQFTGGIVDIDAPDSGDYAGYLIIVEPDYGFPELSENPEACVINGNTNNDYEGTIFAPYCDCTIDGGSTPTGYNAQFLCYTVKLTGNSTINFTYDPDVLGYRDDPAKTGVTK